MKLRKILENNEKENLAKELNSLFQKGVYRNDIKEYIYRGYDRKEEVDGWGLFRIRKNREPKDTSEFLDTFIYYAEEVVDKDLPKRRESKFGSTSRKEASKYGSVYLTFPEDDAKIYSLPRDAFNYFGNVSKAVKDFDREFHRVLLVDEDFKLFDEDPEFEEFLINLLKVYNPRFSEEKYYLDLAKTVLNRDGWIKKMIKKYNVHHKGTSLNEIYYDFVRPITNYFDDLEEGVESNADEIIFDGNHYIMVEEKFFDHYFNWNGIEWRLD